MGKEPSFQYYPKDWRADSVFGCSLAARGLWHEMMNMMHASERYGYLCSNGVPTPDESISRYCGCNLQDYHTLLAELERARVPRRTSNGTIFSKRMVEDCKKRQEWRNRKKIERDRKKKELVKCDVTRLSNESHAVFLSPSPSPSVKTLEPKTLAQQKALSESAGQNFELFWDAYPRKVGKAKAQEVWRKLIGIDLHVLEVISAVDRWKASGQWDDLQYVPHPATFLRQRRWEDEIPTRQAHVKQGDDSAARIAVTFRH